VVRLYAQYTVVCSVWEKMSKCRYITVAIAAVAASYVIYRFLLKKKKNKEEKKNEDNKSNDDVFSRACDKVKELEGLDTNVQLQLYGLFKQATKGKCNTEKPWASDFRGRAKWEAWSKNGTMSKEDAGKAYVSLVDRLAPGWRDVSSSPSSSATTKKKKKKVSQGMGLSVSTLMIHDEENKDEREDDVFVFCSKGETEKVLELVRSGEANVNQKDEEMGMTLLHWACDRGHLSLVKSLLSLGANVNVQDSDGTTPLGTAVLCEYQEVALLLLRSGANPDIKDDTGECPRESFNDELERAAAEFKNTTV
jgi:acyl-CoA-binding protein